LDTFFWAEGVLKGHLDPTKMEPMKFHKNTITLTIFIKYFHHSSIFTQLHMYIEMVKTFKTTSGLKGFRVCLLALNQRGRGFASIKGTCEEVE